MPPHIAYALCSCPLAVFLGDLFTAYRVEPSAPASDIWASPLLFERYIVSAFTLSDGGGYSRIFSLDTPAVFEVRLFRALFKERFFTWPAKNGVALLVAKKPVAFVNGTE